MKKNTIFPSSFPPAWASEWGEDEQGIWAIFCIKDVCQCFRWIPAGTFIMGSPDGTDGEKAEKGRYGWEDQHQVILSYGFWLADTTVTQELWLAVMEKTPSHFSENILNPVEQISWDDIQDFIASLNQLQPELKPRLPSEAEWEYACRAGTTGPFNFTGELSLEKVNYRGIWKWTKSDDWAEGARQATVAVKSMKNSNAWGLHEMHGNVWEWCQDYWQESLGKEAVSDPKGAKQGAGRVVRGGSWFDHGWYVRSALRFPRSPESAGNGIGFRLALGH